MPLFVEGPGLIDCHLHRQPGKLILHLVNLTSAGTWRQPIHELIAVGPFLVRLEMPANVRSKHARLAVANQSARVHKRAGFIHFEVPGILDHELVVVGDV